MFPKIFCSLCAQKLWRVRTFLEMTNVCATTHELKKRSSRPQMSNCLFINFSPLIKKPCFSKSKNNFSQLANREHYFIMICLCAGNYCVCAVSESRVRAHRRTALREHWTWANYGPRAKSGPPVLLFWPAGTYTNLNSHRELSGRPFFFRDHGWQ